MRKKNVVIVGNCQASAVANVYRDFVGNPNLETVTYFNDHDVPPEETRRAVADADLVIVQDRDFNNGLQAKELRPGIAIQPFPMVLAGFIWPYANEPHVRNMPEPPFSDGPYPSQLSDSYLNRLIEKGVPEQEALDRYLALDIARSTGLDRLMEIYFHRQHARDARSGFALAYEIERTYRTEPLFRTPHHPNERLFGLVVTQLFERLGVPGSVAEAAVQSLHTTPFPLDELPIHPGVMRHLDLTFADENSRYSYFDEGRFTFSEYVLRYMRYENNHALRIGIFQADHGAPAEALEQLERGLERSPGSVRGWRARGIALDRLGRHDEACASFNHASELEPANPEGAIALSISLRTHGDAQGALAAAYRAVSITPRYAAALRVLAEAQIAAGEASSAVKTAADVLSLLPSGANLHLLGLATTSAGQLEDAEQAANRLIAMEPNSPDARNLLAEVLEEAERRPEAIAALDAGVSIGVQNAQTYSLLGNFYLRNGDLEASERAFDRGVGLDPSRTDLEACRDDVRAKLTARAAGTSANEVGRAAAAAPPASIPTPVGKPLERAPQEKASHLAWLPPLGDWRARIGNLEQQAEPSGDAWQAMVSLANSRLDFLKTERLDRSLVRLFGSAPPPGLTATPVRLAVLGSSTLDQLLPAIRVAGLRRGLWITTYQTPYGQYRQELLDRQSGLHAFAPSAILFAQDARHILAAADAGLDEASADAAVEDVLADLRGLWRIARGVFHAQVIQQTLLPVFPTLMGSNEYRAPGSPAAMATTVNDRLAVEARDAGVDLLSLDRRAARDGIGVWHDPVLWHRAKQEVSPLAAPLYGDLAARLLAASQGRSAKCLVLDLDNTLWGGVVGDDGVDGIVLGQGSALGEAFADVQAYARALSRRGVMLAVCSKNDEVNAFAAFDTHPEMVLQRADISAFVANWDDKAANLRTIARTLNIGLDALVFVDDNPFERNLVRAAVPEVAVPELPDDPALYPGLISDAGYFEALSLTGEDRLRTQQYQAQRLRKDLASEATDLQGYLRSLDMRLIWGGVDPANLKRTTQLINKTNQFNLTTRRYTEAEVEQVAADAHAMSLRVRLLDRFGDNGLIAVVIGRLDAEQRLDIETWLMSCRVLGRGVEQATFGLIVEEARRLDARALLGHYRPTSKNGMVADLYSKLGFQRIGVAEDGEETFLLDLDEAAIPTTSISILKDAND